MNAENRRLNEDADRTANWKRWGPYLADRQWGTVREDYSASGACWDTFSHDQARSRAYRWGEDGLLGFTDRECRLCLAPALWNGVDPILKERLFGLTNGEGNHGEDVKEVYHFLDALPTAAYAKALYRYPLSAYPYGQLVEENRRRGIHDDEFELSDSGCFDQGHADLVIEYAKAAPDDILMRATLSNRSDRTATLHLLLQVWFRNTWIWGCRHEGCTVKPHLAVSDGGLRLTHETLGEFMVAVDGDPTWLVTDNETNSALLYGHPSPTPYVKDAFHRRIIHNEHTAVHPQQVGTKAAAWYRCVLPAGGSATFRLRLRPVGSGPGIGADFSAIFSERIAEADAFYEPVLRGNAHERQAGRQAYASLIWTKKFYHLIQEDWMQGDPAMPPPERTPEQARNRDWEHFYARDILSMPDGWEYPWFAAWDLAFHCVPFARIDAAFAKQQLELLLREWYLHPNGQIPAYEFAFGDVNPPVHAWAAWRVYRLGSANGEGDIGFLERVFQKLLLNFTWWVNRKDLFGRHVFSGGFLGLDNIGVFDRSKPLPGGGTLVQADGTAWMAFYAARMLTIALELARYNPSYEDIASKFFEHFVHISDALNHLAGSGLWDEQDGFYYDRLVLGRNNSITLRARSMVGIIPLFGAVVVRQEHLDRFPAFAKRLRWFEKNRRDLAERMSWLDRGGPKKGLRLLAIPSRERLRRVLERVFDEQEFLSPHGIRSLSKAHEAQPFALDIGGERHGVGYEPGESRSHLFGGNSNWRGPIWFPVNHLLIEALREYHEFYGDSFTIELPRGSGHQMTLGQAANEIGRRLASLFLPDDEHRLPCHGGEARWHQDPAWRDLPLFYEFFHGDTGKGLGASHQTGWTALVTEYLGGMAPPAAPTLTRKFTRKS